MIMVLLFGEVQVFMQFFCFGALVRFVYWIFREVEIILYWFIRGFYLNLIHENR